MNIHELHMEDSTVIEPRIQFSVNKILEQYDFNNPSEMISIVQSIMLSLAETELLNSEFHD